MFKKILTLWNDKQINNKVLSFLRKKSLNITIPFDKKIINYIENLIDIFLKLDHAVGLAAPQIGICQQIIIFRINNFQKKNTNEKDFDLLINPIILQKKGNEEIALEGCLSCPYINVEVKRFSEIKVRALNQKGKEIIQSYSGFLARIIQHEIDHLHGILIFDKNNSFYFPKEKELLFKTFFKKN